MTFPTEGSSWEEFKARIWSTILPITGTEKKRYVTGATYTNACFAEKICGAEHGRVRP